MWQCSSALKVAPSSKGELDLKDGYMSQMSCNGSATTFLYSFIPQFVTLFPPHHTHTHTKCVLKVFDYYVNTWAHEHGSHYGSLHRSLQLMSLQQALRAGYEMNGERMMGRNRTNRKLETETRARWQRDRDRLTICVLVVISWEEEREATRKSNTKVRGEEEEEEEERARRRKS